MTASPPSGPMFPRRTVVWGTFVPTILFETGMGAVLPVIVATATSVGMGLDGAALLVTVVALGQILADIPAGAIAARIGDRAAMVLASFIAMIGFAGIGLAHSPVGLVLFVLLLGGASASYFLARQSYLTDITHPLRRARVMSTLGGVHRVGLFFGPFIGAGVIAVWGLRSVYLLAIFTCLAALVFVLAFGAEPGQERTAWREKFVAARERTLRQTLHEYWPVLRTLGVAILLIGAIRGARTNVLPLWAEHLGISPEATSVIFGIANAADMLLFYPAGKIMDSFGRLWIGVPAMIIMGASFAVIPFTSTYFTLSIVAVILGFGNGISSGILMTLGADVAPCTGRAQFLGVWRLFSDAGSVLGPAVLTAGAALGSLAAGIWTMAALGAAAVGAQLRWVPRWSPHANRTTRRRAGLIE